MDRIKVMIAEDESAVREALADLVDSDPDMELVGAVKDAAEAIEVALREHPDVALVDVKMPAGGGAHATREIRRGSPQTRSSPCPRTRTGARSSRCCGRASSDTS